VLCGAPELSRSPLVALNVLTTKKRPHTFKELNSSLKKAFHQPRIKNEQGLRLKIYNKKHIQPKFDPPESRNDTYKEFDVSGPQNNGRLTYQSSPRAKTIYTKIRIYIPIMTC